MSWMKEYIKFLTEPLIKEAKIGIGLDALKVTSRSVSKKKAELYILKFEIPYAKQFLVLELIFNSLYPELGPDLIFTDEEDHQTSTRDFLNNFSSLSSWNFMDEQSLVIILHEFIQLYKEHQLNILKSCTDVVALDPGELGPVIPYKNFEINLTQGTKHMEAKLLIQFELDLSSALSLKERTKVVTALLYITFGGTSHNRIIPELYLPGYLTKLFDGSESLHIPPFVEVSCISVYIEKVKECVIEKAKAVSISTEKRKQFIATLSTIQSANVLEFDPINWRSASLLLEHLDVTFVLNFELSLNFPIKQFTMTMQSVHHMTDQGKPMVKIINDFPYSPRWEPKQMIMKALAHVIEFEIKKISKPY